MIGADQQGQGLGTLRHKNSFDVAKQQACKRIACEFDTQAANVISAKFHEGFGLYRVDTQVLVTVKKTVSLQVADV